MYFVSPIGYNAYMGETQPYTLEMYVTPTGRSPFQDWLRGLRDVQTRARIRVRLDRLSLGNPGDAHALSGGVWELRIDYGPGYRVYYAQSGPTTLLVLCGGEKTTQAADIRQAQRYWDDYQRRKRDEQAH